MVVASGLWCDRPNSGLVGGLRFRCFEFDPGFILIRLLAALGLAWDVKMPSEEKIARRLAHQASQGALDLEHG